MSSVTGVRIPAWPYDGWEGLYSFVFPIPSLLLSHPPVLSPLLCMLGAHGFTWKLSYLA